MVVGEFTASNINMEEDAREAEEKQRKSTLDLPKFRADVAAAQALAKTPAQLPAALDALLALEKTARLAEDITGCKLACGAVLEACHQAGEWRLLEENATLLAKRRGQLKQATQHLVRQAMAYLDSAPDKATRVSLIKALQSVTEGKIFVEIERARLTRRLARIKEADGDVAGAADELQEVAVVRCFVFFFFFPCVPFCLAPPFFSSFRSLSLSRKTAPPPTTHHQPIKPQETFGAMAKTEKIAYILDQVRLCLAKGDHARAQILARKVSPRAFVPKRGEEKGQIGIEGTAIEEAEEVSCFCWGFGGFCLLFGGSVRSQRARSRLALPSLAHSPLSPPPPQKIKPSNNQGVPSLPELKLRYYALMVQYHLEATGNYLEVARCFRAVLEKQPGEEGAAAAAAGNVPKTASDAADEEAAKAAAAAKAKEQWLPAIKSAAWYCALTPAYSTEHGSGSDAAALLAATANDKRVSELPPSYKALLSAFTTREIIRWSAFSAQQAAEMDAMPAIFAKGTRAGDAARAALQKRVAEHNVLVVARYYTRVALPRLAQLLDLPPDEAEQELARLVVAKAVAARIDRPRGVVSFAAAAPSEGGSDAAAAAGAVVGAEDPEGLLNGWAGNIGKLLDLVDKASQQIQKECMTHKVTLAAPVAKV